MTSPPNVVKESEQRSRTARHLAAHAIVALRAGFRVERIALDAISNAHGGVVCDWKQAREAYRDDEKLIHRSFALVYVGGLIDQEHLENITDDLRAEMKADMAASEDSRETAVAWNLVASVQETNAFARIGYKLASRLIKKDGPLIEKLSVLLAEWGSVDEASLMEWFQQNASPYSLDELEKTNTY
ncbi:hypothetical protein [Acidobacterium sp. S8]|uniref:hypothetical protein n=1 Tax=Acidobacterium sp. S8 TaxID=1641854 RepID=UPI00131EC403|nr:hypothetical protein [Acidobacterium sp. S8]